MEDTIRNLISQETPLSKELAEAIIAKCSKRISMVYAVNLFLKDIPIVLESEFFSSAFPSLNEIEKEFHKFAKSIDQSSSQIDQETSCSDSVNSSSQLSPSTSYSNSTLFDRIDSIKKQKTVTNLTLKESLQIELQTYRFSSVNLAFTDAEASLVRFGFKAINSECGSFNPVVFK